MTSFETQAMLGTQISPLVATDKGDLTNRVQCSASQAGNTLKHLAADTVVIGGAAYAGKKAIENKGFAKFLSKPLEKLGSILKDAKTIDVVKGAKKVKGKFVPYTKIIKKDNIFTKAGKYIEKIPTKYKALAVVAAVAIPLVNYIGQRFIYRAGQIDQKYTDNAKIMSANRKDLI